MKPEDIYELKLGQRIWHDGLEKEILVLAGMEKTIEFRGEPNIYYWKAICYSCSLEPPKQPEKIKLFRYTLKGESWVWQTEWTSESIDAFRIRFGFYGNTPLLKTEEKEIEY